MQTRTAVITGGRSGMGKACAQLLAEKGANVAIVSRNQAELDKVAGEISAATGNKNILPIAGDVGNESDVKHIVDEALRRFKSIGYLLNFAGYAENYGMISKLRPSPGIVGLYKKIRSVDQDGTVAMTFHVEPVMRKQNSGVIITMSSMPVLDAWENDLLFQIPKAANIQLAKAIASQLKADRIDGVKIYSIAPGNIFNRSTYKSLSKQQREEADKEGWLDSEHVANIVYWILTSRLKLENGDVLRIDASTVAEIFARVGEPYKPFLP